MARGAQTTPPGRPQTLREARRAYQKAGRTPSFTAAQIRAAERAVEQDKRAKDILAKEKRAREAKRKKDEQEAKRREEQKKLVELGKLPEESLWGKVRPSQPRLHNFFSVPQQRKREANIYRTAFPSNGLSREARAQSVGFTDEDSPDPEWTLASAPATLKSQNTTPLLAPQHPSVARIYDRNSAKFGHERGPRDTQAAPGTSVQSDVQLSFSASQFFSDFADDEDLEAELNGLASSEENLHHLSTSKTTGYAGPGMGPNLRKRKAGDATHITPPRTKTALVVFAQMSSSMLNTRALASAGTSCDSPSTIRLCNTNAANKLGNIPTASQMEALFWSQDFEDDGDDSDKENVHRARAAPQNDGRTHDTHNAKSDTKVSQISLQGALGLPKKERLVPERDLGLSCKDSDFFHDSDEDFCCDLDAELLNLPSQPFSTDLPGGLQSRPQEQSVKQTIAPESKVQDPVNGTQESLYDFDSLDDKDLAGLADMLTSSQRLHDASPEMTSSGRTKS
jgi:hypothetical protein